jgi:hypothetical protein
VPDGAYAAVLEYFAKVPALSNSNTTTWLLTNYPNAYLFGTFAEAEAFLGADDQDPRIAMWIQRRDQALERIRPVR